MKKLTLLILFYSLCGIINSQTTKGTFALIVINRCALSTSQFQMVSPENKLVANGLDKKEEKIVKRQLNADSRTELKELRQQIIAERKLIKRDRQVDNEKEPGEKFWWMLLSVILFALAVFAFVLALLVILLISEFQENGEDPTGLIAAFIGASVVFFWLFVIVLKKISRIGKPKVSRKAKNEKTENMIN